MDRRPRVRFAAEDEVHDIPASSASSASSDAQKRRDEGEQRRDRFRIIKFH